MQTNAQRKALHFAAVESYIKSSGESYIPVIEHAIPELPGWSIIAKSPQHPQCLVWNICQDRYKIIAVPEWLLFTPEGHTHIQEKLRNDLSSCQAEALVGVTTTSSRPSYIDDSSRQQRRRLLVSFALTVTSATVGYNIFNLLSDEGRAKNHSIHYIGITEQELRGLGVEMSITSDEKGYYLHYERGNQRRFFPLGKDIRKISITRISNNAGEAKLKVVTQDNSDISSFFSLPLDEE